MTTATELRNEAIERRERAARRMRELTASVTDIGDIPKVKNRLRRNRCKLDLHRFLVTYFPQTTGLSPFSEDHKRVISRIQLCILEGGRFLNVVFRGFGKTTVAENASIWAAIYGHRKFVTVFGADAPSAQNIIDSIKLELSENELLYEDFPEVCHACRALEGRPQRQLSQSYQGQLTHIEWTSEQIVLPMIPGSKASGAVICARGITGGFRGLKIKRPDGKQQRPDFILLDDPQTDESASTALQVSKTLRTLRKAIVKLGGHRKQLAIVVNATVIEPDDAVAQLLTDAAWQGERIPLVKKWPASHKTFWMEQYAELRRSFNKDVVGDQARAWKNATQFYAKHRAEMDLGGEVSWDNCYDPNVEISALQHAYNALIDDGAEAFASEYQVQPIPKEKELGELSPDQVTSRINRHERGLVPSSLQRLTAFIDVQKDLLFWCVCAWNDRFDGAIVDYGTFPKQNRAYFSLKEANPTLSKITQVGSPEGAIWAGLEKLTSELIGREWQSDGGGLMRIEKCLIDSGWNADLIKKFCRQSAHSAVISPSKGYGIRASGTPISDWPIKTGERRGLNWIVQPPKPGEVRIVSYDTNFWKSFIIARLKQPLGEKGAMSIFGDSPGDHRLFADHVATSEYCVRTEGRGRQLDEWQLRPHKPDNHWFDCLTGNAVAASLIGISLIADNPTGPKKRISFAEMQRQKRLSSR